MWNLGKDIKTCLIFLMEIQGHVTQCRFSLNLSCFGFGPSFKGHRSNLWLSSNRITLCHWTLDPHLKWPKEHKVTIKTHKYEQDYMSEAWQFLWLESWMQYQLAKHHEALVYTILWWCSGLKNSPTSFRVLSFWQSLLVMVTFGVFVFSLVKGINNGGPILCEVF